MSVSEWEIAGLEIENQHVSLGAGSQSADLLFLPQDPRRDCGSLQDNVLKAHPEAEHLRHYLRQRDAKRFRRGIPVKVSADGIRVEVMFEGFAGGVPREAAAAMSHVENDSALSRVKRLWKDRFGDHTVAASMEAVSQDIAGA